MWATRLIAGSVVQSRSVFRFGTALRLASIGDLLLGQHPVQIRFRYLKDLSHRIVEAREFFCRFRLHESMTPHACK